MLHGTGRAKQARVDIHMNAELFFDNNSTIVVAACNNPADSSALMRWVLPVLEEWPQQAWRAWLSDQSQPGKVRASLVTGSDKQSGWRDIDVSDFAANGGMCWRMHSSPNISA